MAVCERNFKLLTSETYNNDFIGIAPATREKASPGIVRLVRSAPSRKPKADSIRTNPIPVVVVREEILYVNTAFVFYVFALYLYFQRVVG
jgi:hypothetical protein